MTHSASLASFRGALRGTLLSPQDTDYRAACRLYNAMIDKRPSLIARCTDAADVIAGLRHAREHELPLAIRGGGHSGPGFGSCNDGLVLDLSPMKGVHVDPDAGTVTVAPGCTQGDVDHATHAFGLAVPAGIVSTTGIAGLTLGGGHGYLSRQYGLTVDHLLEADVVLADGRQVTASETQNEDLFWALRGGGGNFGVVTRFLFRAQPVTSVFGGPCFWDIDDAGEVMRRYRDFIVDAPPQRSCFLGLKTVPSTAPFPDDIWGRRICALVACFNEPEATGQAAWRVLREELPEPILDGLQQMPFPALQGLFDGLLPTGLQWYWKGHFVDALPDAAIDVHLEHARRSPSELSLMHLYPINGAVHDRATDDTAWSRRDATWSMVIAGIDADASNVSTLQRWGHDYWQALRPHCRDGGYVNFMMQDEGSARIASGYGDNFKRLQEIKQRYDPDNLFRINQNIEPAGGHNGPLPGP